MYSLSAREPFPSAARQWFEDVKPTLRPDTQKCYLQYIKTLTLFLQQIRLCDIGPGTLREYKKWRSQTAGVYRQRGELCCLKQILREAGLWKRLAETHKLPPLPKEKARQSMSEAEVIRFFKVCFLKPKRVMAAHCLIVMMYTSMGFGELRRLRRRDVVLDMDIPYVSINGDTKNDYRIRTVTLNRLALRSMRWIIRRWQDLGGTDGDQFILPHRAAKKGTGWQFNIPMGHIYRAATGILHDAGLTHLVPYDMRSQFITGISGDPECSDQMYSELAGHSPKDLKMRARYSRQQLEKKALITDKLCEFSNGFEPERVGFTVIAGGKKA